MRELRQIEDADGRVTAFGDQLDHGALQAFALVARDLLARQPMRAGGQSAVARAVLAGPVGLGLRLALGGP